VELVKNVLMKNTETNRTTPAYELKADLARLCGARNP
jgi:hypothetical protein